MKKNLYCVVDACSYIYLKQFSFTFGGRDKSLFDILSDTSIIRYSTTVKDEITRNSKLSSSEALKLSRWVHPYSNFTLQEFDSHLFDSTLNISVSDKGEKENLCVTIDLFKSAKQPIIFLSDDKKATGLIEPVGNNSSSGHLSEKISAFPFCKVWNSFDVINYLYFSTANVRTPFNYDMAETAIKDLTTFIYTPQHIQLEKNRKSGIITEEDFITKKEALRSKSTSQYLIAVRKLNAIHKLLAA